VDDSVDILAAFERLLRGALPDVVVGAALNGVAALELFTQHVWDVVVLDFPCQVRAAWWCSKS
jgi:CheY-like chemotaxis protein